MEKQKAKYLYGILERQFRNLFEKANKSKGITGEVLLQLCESRLDNLVYRMGIAPTRSAARQLVSHEHIIVNGSLCNIPSRLIKIGEKVGVREKSKSLNVIEESLTSKESVYEWISWDNNTMEGVYNTLPSRDQIPENIKEQLIVELYSK
jgi:small subunit ribosomal protein S4